MRYEDLRNNPVETMRRAMSFIGASFDEDEIRHAVEFASFENLRKLERSNYFHNAGLRLRNPKDPDTFKVRRGKMGGYRDYFTAEQVALMEDMVYTRLSPALGYADVGPGLERVADSG